MRGVSAVATGGDKYYVGVEMCGVVRTIFIDTGSEISIMDQGMVRGMKREKLDQKVKLSAYDGDERAVADEVTTVELDFKPGKIKIQFLVSPVPEIIIGADVLRSAQMDLSLDTKTALLQVKGNEILTSTSAAEALASYMERSREGDVGDGGESAIMRLQQTIELPPEETIIALAEVHGEVSGSEVVLQSDFDYDDTEIYVPTILLRGDMRKFEIPILNKTHSTKIWRKGMALGRVWKVNGARVGNVNMELYEVTDLVCERINGQGGWEKAPTTIANASAVMIRQRGYAGNDPAEEETTTSGPVKFTEIAGRNQIADDVVQRAFKEGVLMNVRGENVCPEVDLEGVEGLEKLRNG